MRQEIELEAEECTARTVGKWKDEVLRWGEIAKIEGAPACGCQMTAPPG